MFDEPVGEELVGRFAAAERCGAEPALERAGGRRPDTTRSANRNRPQNEGAAGRRMAAR
ncbi:MAG: hypothetical protein HY599_03145 [Candidatus Omnitrophica bacterium]|nr:hypothetical protein [Candidatus Omnitrophota bacterium]